LVVLFSIFAGTFVEACEGIIGGADVSMAWSWEEEERGVCECEDL